jgi:hypothetical protein
MALYIVRGIVVKSKWFLFNLNGRFFEIVSSHPLSTNAYIGGYVFRRKKTVERKRIHMETFDF